MKPINKYPPGTFNWADLATSDASGAKAFYSSLFDWTAEDIPVGSGVFTMLYGSGKEAASLYQLSHQQRAQGIPSHWVAYVAVASADDTAILAQQLGGQVLVAPFDVLDLGLLLDPTGMPFALWQAGRHEGSQLVGQPGMMVWNDLMTPDPLRAAAFYTQLFDWQVSTVGDGSWIFSRNIWPRFNHPRLAGLLCRARLRGKCYHSPDLGQQSHHTSNRKPDGPPGGYTRSARGRIGPD